MAAEESAAGAQAQTLRVGVLALQGSFREHIASLRRCSRPGFQVEAVEVRKREQLQGLQGLIIPGGESTTMAHVAERNGMIPALREFEASMAPIWGTCAGLIFLADRALGQKMGGQALLGGLDCTVHRNFFGSQINSFETNLPAPPQFSRADGSGASPGSSSEAAQAPFRAVFIRAPAIVETGPEVEVLSEYQVREAGSAPPVPPEQAMGELSLEEAQLAKLEKVAVAVKQGQLLATAFHPELTADLRWHELFLSMVIEHLTKAPPSGAVSSSYASSQPPPNPGNLPVYGPSGTLSIELKL